MDMETDGHRMSTISSNSHPRDVTISDNVLPFSDTDDDSDPVSIVYSDSAVASSSQGTEPFAENMLVHMKRRVKYQRVKRKADGSHKDIWSTDNYTSRLCQMVYRQQQDGMFTDFELRLKPSGTVMKVHKSILYTTCRYFSSLFNSGMVETHLGYVEFENMDENALKVIVEYMYTGRMSFGGCKIEDLVECSRRLQNDWATDICCKWLLEKCTKENCVEYYNLADKFGMEKARETLYLYIKCKFVAMADHQLLALSGDQLKDLIESHDLLCFSELDVFNRVHHWIQVHDPDHTLYTTNLIKLIRFPLMKAEDLVTVVGSIPYMNSIPECSRILSEAKDYHLVSRNQPCTQTVRSMVRHSGLICMAFCHDSEFYIYPVSSRHYKLNEQIPYHEMRKPLSNLIIPSVCTYNNFLFACGGILDRNHANISTGRCFRYNPRDDSWLEVASMVQPRQRFRLESVDGLMFAIGGTDEGRVCSTYECYDFAKDTWESHPRLVTFHQASRYPSCSLNSSIYVSGGAISTYTSNAMVEYKHDAVAHRGKLVMRNLPPMLTGRRRHRMIGYNNTIYVIGGIGETAQQITNIDIFNTLTEQWSQLTKLPDISGLRTTGIIAVLRDDPERVVIISSNERDKAATCLMLNLTKNPKTEPSEFCWKMNAVVKFPQMISSFGAQLWMPAADLIAKYPQQSYVAAKPQVSA